MSARRAAVLGSPIAHSRSPLLHRAAYAALGLDWTYDAIEVTPAGLEDFLATCEAPEWVGLSLTMPLKSDVIPLLDGMSDLGRTVGAINTVVLDGTTRLGHNTDVGGMVHALEECSQRVLAPTSGAIIGGGATARSALAALAQMGVRHADVVVRSPERARDRAVPRYYVVWRLPGAAVDVTGIHHGDIRAWEAVIQHAPGGRYRSGTGDGPHHPHLGLTRSGADLRCRDLHRPGGGLRPVCPRYPRGSGRTPGCRLRGWALRVGGILAGPWRGRRGWA